MSSGGLNILNKNDIMLHITKTKSSPVSRDSNLGYHCKHPETNRSNKFWSC